MGLAECGSGIGNPAGLRESVKESCRKRVMLFAAALCAGAHSGKTGAPDMLLTQRAPRAAAEEKSPLPDRRGAIR